MLILGLILAFTVSTSTRSYALILKSISFSSYCLSEYPYILKRSDLALFSLSPPPNQTNIIPT